MTKPVPDMSAARVFDGISPIRALSHPEGAFRATIVLQTGNGCRQYEGNANRNQA